MAGLPWIRDDITGDEALFLEGVRGALAGDLEFLRRVLSASWIRDGTAREEQGFLLYLLGTVELWPEVAHSLASFPTLIADAPATLRSRAAASIASINDRNHLLSLTDAAWYSDGLSPAEAAFITTLPPISHQYSHLFQSLLDDFYSQSTTVTLDLAGEVTIWAFQNTPFPPDEPLLDRIATAAQAGELFLGVPLPTDHIILLVTDRAEPGFVTGGWHFGSHMLLPRRDGEVPNVAHETAHYFFWGGPFWLNEGAANYLEYHVVAEEDPVARRSTVEHKASGCLKGSRAENIRHFLLVTAKAVPVNSNCEYFLGERFLFRVADVMGHGTLGAALRELFPTRRVPRLREAGFDEEEHVYRTLVKHVPEGKEAAFNAVYRELHGGFEGFEVPEELDDHGNTRTSSTPLVIGIRAEGVLDYAFDEDYFATQLDSEGKYEVIFEHAVSTSSLALFAGSEDPFVRFRRGDRLSKRFVVPPKTATYYFAAQNFGGEPGPYSLLVRIVPPVEDDHGDFLTSATEVAIGEDMSGVLHDSTDFDYFRLTLREGRTYQVDIEHHDRQIFRMQLLDGEGARHETWIAGEFEFLDDPTLSLQLVVPDSGEYYVLVDGAEEENVSYTLVITEEES